MVGRSATHDSVQLPTILLSRAACRYLLQQSTGFGVSLHGAHEILGIVEENGRVCLLQRLRQHRSLRRASRTPARGRGARTTLIGMRAIPRVSFLVIARVVVGRLDTRSRLTLPGRIRIGAFLAAMSSVVGTGERGMHCRRHDSRGQWRSGRSKGWRMRVEGELGKSVDWSSTRRMGVGGAKRGRATVLARGTRNRGRIAVTPRLGRRRGRGGVGDAIGATWDEGRGFPRTRRRTHAPTIGSRAVLSHARQTLGSPVLRLAGAGARI